ncbi:MAG: hypothetical protein JWR19_876 [Pedosphaera sp.]|nr:hypothetical protein [Pedosphaera sp.]
MDSMDGVDGKDNKDGRDDDEISLCQEKCFEFCVQGSALVQGSRAH